MTKATDKAQDKVLDKIRKLLALSTSPNENEAALAAEKAQALLAEHNLSMSQVSDDKKDDKLGMDKEIRTESEPWKRFLGTCVSELFFTRYFYTVVKERRPHTKYGFKRFDLHTFVGAQHNIEVAKSMFLYMAETIDRLATEGARSVPAKERYHYTTAFRNAAVMRINVRIQKRIKAAKEGNVKSENTGNTLPALASLYDQTNKQLTQFIKEQVGELGKGRGRVRLNDARGARDGAAAGDKIGLDAQVGGKKAARQLAH